MADYRYLFHRLRTNGVVAELPLVDVTYEPQAINGDGTFTAGLPALDEAAAEALEVLDATAPGRRVLYIVRDDRPIYAGIVWARRYNSKDGRFTIAGSEPSSYMRRRRWVPANRSYTNVSDRTIFADLVNDANSGTPIGLTPVIPGAGGNLRSRAFYVGDLNVIAENVEGLAEEDPGFEWANEVADDAAVAGGIAKRLVYAVPRRGRSADLTRLVLEYPGNVTVYDWPEDAATTANTIWGLGRAAAANLDLSAVSQNATRFTVEDWPLLEDVLQASEVTDQAHLNRLVASERARRDDAIVLPELTVRPELLDDLVVGDRARLYIDDARRFPEPWEGIVRLVGLTVRADRAGREVVTVRALPWPSAST